MGLNNRQKELYNYMLSKYETEEFITKKEICRDLPYCYPRHLENNNNEGNKSGAFRKISSDVRAINNSEVEHIIISNHKGFKIAKGKEEATRYIDSRFKRDLKSLKLDWELRKKVNNDRQLAINEDSFKVIETFISNLN